MIRVAQFGEGNFLRAFADVYFDTLNKEGNDYRVTIVKPTARGNLDKFTKQNNKYHVVLRGVRDGQAAEDAYRIDCLDDAIDPHSDFEAFLALAREKDLKLIISNTTEAGICFSRDDTLDRFEGSTFPAKLTRFLYERFQSGAQGVYLLPVELIDNNAEELYKCVDAYIRLWDLPEAFKKWNDEQNFYCDTLVDRIVSGYPREQETKEHLFSLIGQEDDLLAVGEPFGLWVIRKKGQLDRYMISGKHNVNVVLTDDIAYYKKRKVRVLNGSHTNLVALGLLSGKGNVFDCMNDSALSQFMEETLSKEIIPFVSDDITATAEFAAEVRERFQNPFLDHRLIGIALNSISKWKARILPSFRDYYRAYGRIPPLLSRGFGYLMALYESVRKEGDHFVAMLPSGPAELRDEPTHLQFFSAGGNARTFMQNADVFGEDLTAYDGFADLVEDICRTAKKEREHLHED